MFLCFYDFMFFQGKDIRSLYNLYRIIIITYIFIRLFKYFH